jgi:hypothetical protein
MWGRDRKYRLFAFAVYLALFAGTAHSGDTGSPGRRSAIASADGSLGRRFQEAKLLAARKVSTPSCRQIFTDFRNADGRPLQEVLDERGLNAAEHLMGIRFADAARAPACDRDSLLALTSSGANVVFLCCARFRERALAFPSYAANILIHEQLHSLGLGENPPSSEEITLQVVSRCGR